MEGVREGLKRLHEKYEIAADGRGKGLLLGIEFGPPKSLKLRAGGRRVETVKKGYFAELIVVGLRREYRLLSQDSVNGRANG